MFMMFIICYICLLPSGCEENKVLRGVSIPKEYFVIGGELKIVRVVGTGESRSESNPTNRLSKRSKPLDFKDITRKYCYIGVYVHGQ